MVINFNYKKYKLQFISGDKMKKNILVIFIALFFIKNVSADINKEVLDLKNEFKQIKEIYENKIEALEAKIEKLENEKINRKHK